VIVAAMLLPACVVGAVGLVSLIANVDGVWVWRPDAVTLPEAVVTGNYAEVVAQIQRGIDPNVPADIRANLLTTRPLRVTPLQAAVLGRNALMLQLLLDNGAIVGPTSLAVLKCINEQQQNREVQAVLDALPAGPAPACDALPLP
jgi:hypothetical protein